MQFLREVTYFFCLKIVVHVQAVQAISDSYFIYNHRQKFSSKNSSCQSIFAFISLVNWIQAPYENESSLNFMHFIWTMTDIVLPFIFIILTCRQTCRTVRCFEQIKVHGTGAIVNLYYRNMQIVNFYYGNCGFECVFGSWYWSDVFSSIRCCDILMC